MSLRTECHAQAVGLLAELRAVEAALPRREILTAWLEEFIARTAASGAAVGPADREDLAALGKFLRGRGAR